MSANSGAAGSKPQLLISGFQSKRITSSSPSRFSSIVSRSGTASSAFFTVSRMSSSDLRGGPSSSGSDATPVRNPPRRSATAWTFGRELRRLCHELADDWPGAGLSTRSFSASNRALPGAYRPANAAMLPRA